MSLYDNLYLNNCWRYENQTFLLKANVPSLHSKNLNAKIKEINVLLNFSQMFNMRALDTSEHKHPSSLNFGAISVWYVGRSGRI